MLRVAFIFAFTALLMFGMAISAPQKTLDLEDKEDTDPAMGMLFGGDEGDGGFDGDYDDDDDEAIAKVLQSDVPRVVLNTNTIRTALVDPKTDPTDLNNNGVIGDGELGSVETTDPSDKQCKNTVTPVSGRNEGGGAHVHGGCAKPRSPKNGGIRIRGNYAEYLCHRGYKLHGPKRIRCIRANGKDRWQHRAPVCKLRSRH